MITCNNLAFPSSAPPPPTAAKPEEGAESKVPEAAGDSEAVSSSGNHRSSAYGAADMKPSQRDRLRFLASRPDFGPDMKFESDKPHILGMTGDIRRKQVSLLPLPW